MSDIEDAVGRRKATIDGNGRVSWDDLTQTVRKGEAFEKAEARISKALEDETEWRRQLDEDLFRLAQAVMSLNMRFEPHDGVIKHDMLTILERRVHGRSTDNEGAER